MLKKCSFLLFSFFIGIVVGLATVFGQKYLPGALNSLANSGSVWVVPAFYIAKSYKQKWKSIISSMIYLLICVTTYWYYSISWKIGFTIGFHQAIWLCCAVIFGFIFGLGGNISQYGKGTIKYLCKVMLPATFLSESLMLISHFQQYSHMLDVIFMWFFIGISLYFINCKKEWYSKHYLLALLIMLSLGFLGYQLIYYSDVFAWYFKNLFFRGDF